jgi:hypothetical protein
MANRFPLIINTTTGNSVQELPSGDFLDLSSSGIANSGNITVNASSFFIGNGSQLTGLAASYGNANVVANLAALGSNPVSTTGNVTAGYFIGNGSQLTGLPAGYSNSNLASLGSNVISTSGNVTGGNFLTGGLISATGNILAGNIIVIGGFYDTGDHLVTSTAANANIVLTPTGTGITQNNGAFSASGNVTGGNVLTAGIMSSTGNAIHGNMITAGIMSSTGNAIHGNMTVSTGTITVGNIVNANGNAVGNIGSSSAYFNTIFGKATTAQYADLAELYSTDAEYAPGTVLVFGGNQEVTISTASSDPRVAGVVSTDPAYLMNSTLDSKHKVAVALTGRVPTSVTGTVRKGDMMITAGNGHAQASAAPAMGTVIGKALEDFDGVSGVIEVVVGRL